MTLYFSVCSGAKLRQSWGLLAAPARGRGEGALNGKVVHGVDHCSEDSSERGQAEGILQTELPVEVLATREEDGHVKNVQAPCAASEPMLTRKPGEKLEASVLSNGQADQEASEDRRQNDAQH